MFSGDFHIVLVLCWILINLHIRLEAEYHAYVLVLCWILINLHKAHHEPPKSHGFSTLLDIDKLTPAAILNQRITVLVLCWILITIV